VSYGQYRQPSGTVASTVAFHPIIDGEPEEPPGLFRRECLFEGTMAALLEAITVKRKMYFEFENTPYYCMEA